MKTRILLVNPKFDLEILLYPSFANPLFHVQSNRIVKLWGVCKGLTIVKKGDELIAKHNDNECLNYVEEVLGIWSLHPKNSNIDEKYSEFVEMLRSEYSWLGIATSSIDDVEIFASIFLSQNTDFHTNVVKWIQIMLMKYGKLEHVINLDRIEIAKEISRSYQVLNLVNALEEYLKFRNRIIIGNDEDAKKLLLKIKGIGPKVSHAYLVFVKKSTIYAPIDRNLISFLSKFGVTSNIVAYLPRKTMCIRCTCNECPFKINCTYYRMRNAFGGYSAWIQTVAYVHTKLMCKLKRCSKCFLKLLCSRVYI
jgi:endonuclease III-like uncharacterized protein